MWNIKLDSTLKNIGFDRLKSEPCVYVKRDRYSNILCILVIYVDDILIFGKEQEIEKVKFEINNEFKLSDIGPVDYIIGIKFIKLKDGYFIHQLQYINKILDRFNIDNYREISNVIFKENKDLRNKSFNSKIYMQAIGREVFYI